MTMPTHQCPWRMQVHHIHQETPDVWTISLLCHDYYPYRAGQYALISVRNSAETRRAYTLSSTPGVSEYITLTVRRIDDGAGSQWLTRDVKRGDYLWLSDAMGDVIFAEEWRQYPVTLVAENNATAGFVAGRLTTALLQQVPDLASRTVMTCGPAPYMDLVEREVKALGVTRFFKEQFFTPVAEAVTSGLKFTKLQPAKEFYAPVGTTLLDALESNKVPVTVACRAGVCGCCKTKVVSGDYTVSSTMTLTDAEIAEGYVLACSCHPQGDLVLA